MAWLRVDDGLAQHPKIMKLARSDRWTWVEVLCYCARYRTKGVIPSSIGEAVRGATPAFLDRCFELRLLDLEGRTEEYVVHDWPLYNGETIAEKVAFYLAQFPDASANDVHRAIGGKREIVLSEVASQRYLSGSLSGSEAGSESVPEQSTPEVPLVRAREPVPKNTEVANATSGKRAPDELWEALVAEIGDVSTKNERGARNNAVKQLREIGATPEDVRQRCAQYRRTWPQLTLTDVALVKHWSRMAPSKAAPAKSVDEVLNLPEADRAENAKRARETAARMGSAA